MRTIHQYSNSVTSCGPLVVRVIMCVSVPLTSVAVNAISDVASNMTGPDLMLPIPAIPSGEY